MSRDKCTSSARGELSAGHAGRRKRRRRTSSISVVYLLARVVRRLAPDALVRSLLRRNWIIRAGAESSHPDASIDFYVRQMRQRRCNLPNRRVLIFGYGGKLDVAMGLLEHGAGHVVVCDQLAEAEHRHNMSLLPRYSKYLIHENGRVVPRAEYITMLHGDIRDVEHFEPVDVILSNSVLEHVSDVPGTAAALGRIMSPLGIQIHRIDLRDHYFKYPFEMLRFSRWVWENLLNPSSHHNRYRAWHFRYTFERYFDEVDTEVLHSDPEEFKCIRKHIKPDFLNGDAAEEAAAIILLVVRRKRT